MREGICIRNLANKLRKSEKLYAASSGYFKNYAKIISSGLKACEAGFVATTWKVNFQTIKELKVLESKERLSRESSLKSVSIKTLRFKNLHLFLALNFKSVFQNYKG